MNTATRCGSLLRSLLYVVAPLDCVVCGSLAEAAMPYPLCRACSGAVLALQQGEPGGQAARCSVCGKSLVSTLGTCTRCRGVDYSFDSAVPMFRYAGDLRTILLAYKSRNRRSLAGFFAPVLARTLCVWYPGRVVVPVPPRPGKLRRKGWDQVELLARELERHHGITVHRILRREGGQEQKALDLAGRAANLKGKVRVIAEPAGQAGQVPGVPPDPVLLDDVLTTGATLSECAAALKAAGARRVDAVTIAAD